MFYLYEIALRGLFLCLSFGLTGLTCYLFRKDLLFLLLLPSFQTNHPITHLIFTNPVEVFKITVFIVILFTVLFWLPYLIWICFDFLRPALYTKEVKKIENFIKGGFLIFFCGNLAVYYFCLPTLWDFFSSFEERTDLIDIVLELRAEAYFDFIFDTLILSNVLICGYAFFFWLLLKSSETSILQSLISFKKYIYLFFIILGTALTPPDVTSQLLVFSILAMFYEGCCLMIIWFLNYKKKYKPLS